MERKGAIAISFSVIFSIIIIIAIIAISFYTINYFLGLSRCTQISLFFDDFDRSIEKVWNSEIARDTFSAGVPSGIDAICFREPGGIGSGKEYEALEDYFIEGGNMFLYPPESSCEQASRTAEHLNLTGVGWKCFQVEKNKVEIRLEKESFDTLVRIS